MKNNILIIIISLGIAFTSLIYFKVGAQEKEVDFFDQWYIWKIKYGLTERQKEAIEYFQKVAPIFTKANSTMSRPEGSLKARFDPKESVEIVNDSLKSIKEIMPADLCDKHYRLIVKAIGCIKDYQENRMVLGDKGLEIKIREDETFKNNIRDIQIRQFRLEEEAQKEQFHILHNVGFYDNLPNEAFKLKLITKKQKEELEKKSVKSDPTLLN
jgi:hypothetical protein